MPRCRLAIRSLLHSRSSLVQPSPPCQPTWRRYTTAVEEGRGHEHPPLDLSKETAESSYLDWILGPQDGELPSGASHIPQLGERSGEEKGSDDGRSISSGKTRRERLAQSDIKYADRQQRASSTKITADGEHDQYFSTGKGQQPLRKSAVRKTRTEAKPLRPTKIRALRFPHANAVKMALVRSAGGFSAGFSSDWQMQFARIQRHQDKVLGEHTSRLAPIVHEDAVSWARELFNRPEESMSMALGRLAGFSITKKTFYWSQIALWLLYDDPEKMVPFMRGTHVFPYAPIACIDDSLRYLATHFSHEQDLHHLQALADLFPLLAHRERAGRLYIQGSFFRLLMPHCSHEQINEMYRAIKVHHVKVEWHTFLHFATYFAKSEHFEQALDALLEARNANADLDSFPFRSNCSTLLRNSIRQPAGLRVCLRIVDNLVKIGVKLNNQLCNIVMLNAVEAGDLKTAFSIYSSLVEHGLEADKYTYAILLKGCKSAIDDAETLNATIRAAITHVQVVQEPVVATEILHCLALHHKKHNPERAFDTVADAFVQLFDSIPLEQLGVLPTRGPQAGPLPAEKMQPPSQAMGIMIAMYLDHVFARSQSTSGAYELYKRFRSLVESGLEPFVSLTETDHIANCFLMTFIKKKQGLLPAAQVIKDMQRTSDDLSSREQCKPTQQTWSIFVHGFSRHGQMKLAEQVLNYMRGKGMEPNKVTWNTLATGYASAQDVEGTLDVLRRMEADSVTWDEWTLNGVRKLQDQERLRNELERRRETPQLDFTTDIKDGLGERLNAFGEAAHSMEHKKQEVVDGVADSPSDLAESGAQLYTPFN